MGPLRRDGFLLNAEPLGHVRSFPNSLLPFLPPPCLAAPTIGPPIIISIRATSG